MDKSPGALLSDAKTPEEIVRGFEAVNAERRQASSKPTSLESLTCGADQTDYDEFIAKHPDYFPDDTPIEKRIEEVGNINARFRQQDEERRQKFRDLDQMTEAANKEREFERLRGELDGKALEVLKAGNPMEFLLEGFRYNHAGHEENARAIIYAFCAQSSGTSKGIQPEVTGSKGSGKSHSITSTLFLMPEEYVWDSSFSPKFLYYKSPKQGCIIYIDERLSDELVNHVKKIMSNFQRETRLSTLLDRKPVELVIPKRIVIMGSTVNGAGDDQYNDRTVQIGILNTPEDDERYYEFESRRRAEGRPEYQLNEHIQVCRAILRHIREREFVVTIPRIQFAYLHDKRLINILFDFVEASAILNYMRREHTSDGKTVTVKPSNEDLTAALGFEMFRMNNAETEGRLTRAEMALHQKVQSVIRHPEGELTEGEIAEAYGKSQNAIRKLLYGDGGTQNHITGGLVDKTPGWYTITPSTNPDLKGVNVIRCKKIQQSIGGAYAVFE